MNANRCRKDGARESAAAAGTVHRVMQLVQCLIEANGPIGITEIRTKLQLPVATIHRLLGLLVDVGIVEGKQAGRRYKPGAELIRLAALLQSQQGIESRMIGTIEHACRASRRRRHVLSLSFD